MMARLRSMTAFTAVVLRQATRDRSALFFMVVLPVAIIIIIGSTFGGAQRISVGLVVPEDSRIGAQLAHGLQSSATIKVIPYGSVEDLRADVRRFAVSGGIVIPASIDRSVAGGEPAEIGLIALPTSDAAFTVRRVVTGVADEIGTPLAAAGWVASAGGGEQSSLLVAANRIASTDGPAMTVRSVTIGSSGSATASTFSATAANNLVLFTFISSLTAATILVNARKTGILRRATATPVGVPMLLAGITLGWFVLAILQSTLLIVVGSLLFGVEWGRIGPAIALVALFALVGCGAGLLVGAIGNDEDRVASITPPIGIVLGALGGCMVPLEVFPPVMRSISRFVPHSWAVDAWNQLMVHGAGWAEIGTNLLMLSGFAIAMLTISVLVMRRTLLRP